MPVISVLQSCDLAGPMSCNQMELIWVSAHAPKCTVLWIAEQVRHVCKYSTRCYGVIGA